MFPAVECVEDIVVANVPVTEGGVTAVYARLFHRIQKGLDKTGHRRTKVDISGQKWTTKLTKFC